LIDIHFHCLPGIDDGPRTWEEAVALCRAAEADGVDTIIATPHVLRDPWLNEDQRVRDQLILELNTRLGGHPAILPGCEYYFSSDAVELWQRGLDGPLTGLNRSSCLLIEFPPAHIPKSAEAVFHELSLIGVTPVIAHPERNAVIADDPGRLTRLIEIGAMAQVTAGSIVGRFGRRVQSACDELFERGLVRFIASDAHSVEGRPPELAAATRLVRQKWPSLSEPSIFEQPDPVRPGEG